MCVRVRGLKSRLQDMTVKPLSGFRSTYKQAKQKLSITAERQERKFKLLNGSPPSPQKTPFHFFFVVLNFPPRISPVSPNGA